MCSNIVVFLQEERETIGMCTHVVVFLQEERDCRHVY